MENIKKLNLLSQKKDKLSKILIINKIKKKILIKVTIYKF